MTTWWQRGAIYQIYPRSFADAAGDGVGDLRGIVQRLDHLSELGVEAVWLSPIFPSPMADFGYDVADYCDIDPLFGTLEDFDALTAECHARGIRVILDWVPNHTSDQHPWFQASRSSRDDPKRDWYVWRDGKDGGPPNDWESVFKSAGPSWTFDDATGQWYLHSFLVEQPDLNWDNPEVEAAMHDVLRFWLDRGTDGLRLDAISRIAKDPLLRDQKGATRARNEDWETIHERLRGIRRVVDEYDDRMLVGEVALHDLHRTVSYLRHGDQLHLAHNFLFAEQEWDAEGFRTSIDDFEAIADPESWPAWFISNHDKSRATTRFGLGAARAIGVMLYALRGTPFVYQGEELCLPDAEIPADRVVDVDGRDPQRAPIPWEPPSEAGPGAGFTTGEPWLPLIAEAEELCAARQAADPGSPLSLHRTLLALRRATPALTEGSYRSLDAGKDIYAYERGEEITVALNFASERHRVRLSGTGRLVLSTRPEARHGEVLDLAELELEPDEGVVLAPGS